MTGISLACIYRVLEGARVLACFLFSAALPEITGYGISLGVSQNRTF